jgi:2-amino-4-hydroxy-6-hydroxymethyldihydropteridine diphosphokinase
MVTSAGHEAAAWNEREGGVFIGLGSNLGDRAGHIRAALQELGEAGDIRVLRCSALHETAPVGGPRGQPAFLNAAAELATRLTPRSLLVRLLAIEARHGRVRGARNGPRTLDLDLLIYRDKCIDEPCLTVPHPRMWEREFVLAPLRELCDLAALPVRPPAGV